MRGGWGSPLSDFSVSQAPFVFYKRQVCYLFHDPKFYLWCLWTNSVLSGELLLFASVSSWALHSTVNHSDSERAGRPTRFKGAPLCHRGGVQGGCLAFGECPRVDLRAVDTRDSESPPWGSGQVGQASLGFPRCKMGVRPFSPVQGCNYSRVCNVLGAHDGRPGEAGGMATGLNRLGELGNSCRRKHCAWEEGG